MFSVLLQAEAVGTVKFKLASLFNKIEQEASPLGLLATCYL
ncbi:MAG: hypothetical protein RLZZ574_2328 [Cyanobacteriota bacterium]|jgi:hypothetical protein